MVKNVAFLHLFFCFYLDNVILSEISNSTMLHLHDCRIQCLEKRKSLTRKRDETTRFIEKLINIRIKSHEVKKLIISIPWTAKYPLDRSSFRFFRQLNPLVNGSKVLRISLKYSSFLARLLRCLLVRSEIFGRNL